MFLTDDHQKLNDQDSRFSSPEALVLCNTIRPPGKHQRKNTEVNKHESSPVQDVSGQDVNFQRAGTRPGGFGSLNVCAGGNIVYRPNRMKRTQKSSVFVV